MSDDALQLRTLAVPRALQRPTPHYRWHVGDLRTGRIWRTLDLHSTRWTTGFDGAGTFEGSHPLNGGEWPTARSDAAPAKSFIAVSYVDDQDIEYFIGGGPIWTSRYSDRTGVLQIGAAALGSYFDHRKVLPVLGANQNPAEASVTYTGAQLGLIAKRLVQLAQSHTGGNLPIVLPTDASLGGTGDIHTRTYPGYELGWVGERLRQLSDVDGGPEIQYVPRRRTDDPRFIEWVMRIGVAPSMMLTQTGPPWVYDRTVPESGIISVDVATDGASMTFRSWAAGQGEGKGRPIVVANAPALVDAGWPLLESEVGATDTVSSTTTLRAHARGQLAIGGSPIETWSVVAHRDTFPTVGRLRAGDWIELRLRDHNYLPDGDHDMRVLTISGGDSADVTLALAPRLAEVA